MIGLAAALAAASPAAAAEPCFQPTREFSGIWINEFEGSRFIENGRSLADVPGWHEGEQVWLDMEHSRWADNNWRRYPGHVYRVRFRGRAACDMHRETAMMGGYGHLGMSNGLVVVDYLYELDDLGEAPRGR